MKRHFHNKKENVIGNPCKIGNRSTLGLALENYLVVFVSRKFSNTEPDNIAIETSCIRRQ